MNKFQKLKLKIKEMTMQKIISGLPLTMPKAEITHQGSTTLLAPSEHAHGDQTHTFSEKTVIPAYKSRFMAGPWPARAFHLDCEVDVVNVEGEIGGRQPKGALPW